MITRPFLYLVLLIAAMMVVDRLVPLGSQAAQAAPQAHQDRGLTNSAARIADALERIQDVLERHPPYHP